MYLTGCIPSKALVAAARAAYNAREAVHYGIEILA
jgi:pyruvate/2-oxoglutarate dehydrogenase complex dihydrolipoamide dehydrogenase (E3) component